MFLDKIYEINLNYIRLFLFYSEFLSIRRTIQFFGITKQALFHIFENLEKTLRVKIFIKENLAYNRLTNEGKILKKNLYNYFINLKNEFEKRKEIDIGYINTLPRKDLVFFYKEFCKDLDICISFIKLDNSEIIKLVYLGEIIFGIVDNINTISDNIGYFKLNSLSSNWSLFKGKNEKYIKFIHNEAEFFYNEIDTIFESDNIDVLSDFLQYNEYISYLPESKFKDFDKNRNFDINKTNIINNKYFIFNKNIILNNDEEIIKNFILDYGN